MPEFCNAIHVRTDDQGAVMEAVEEVLARAGFDIVAGLPAADDGVPRDPSRSPLRRFLISPSTNGWVSIFDENFVDIFDLPPRLSAETGCPALLLWANGDRAWGYELCDDGRDVDRYATDPNYLEGPSQGRPDVLSRYSSGSENQFALLFKDGEGLPKPSLRVFAKLFGIVNAESDYETLKGGDGTEVQRYDEFVEMVFLKR